MNRAMPLLLAAIGVAMDCGGSPAGTYRCTDRSGARTYTDSVAQLQGCEPINSPGTASTAGPSVQRESPPEGDEIPLAESLQRSGQDRNEEVIVPVQRRGSILVVQVQLLERTADLILDTGASHTVLSRALARELGLVAMSEGMSVPLKTAGGTVPVDVVRIPEVRVGDAKAADVLAAIHDLPDGLPGVEGLLGLTFLRHFVMKLDVEQGLLHLQERH